MSVDTETSDPTKAVALTAQFPGLKLMLSRIASEAMFAGDSAEQNTQIQLDILERMMGAEDEDELFRLQEAGTTASKDYLNTPFRLAREGITWKKSSIATSGLPFWALLNVTEEETGDSVTISCGAPNVIGVLDLLLQWDAEDRPMEKRSFARWEDFGGRPFQFVGKVTAGGNTLVLIKPLEKNPPAPRATVKTGAKK